MTIAISNDFLSAFSNVQKSQQRQVREFIEKFREHPDSPGSNYEVIQSAKDRQLFSVRVNQAYRAIVFHPPNSEVYILTWVDHHDEAYRWAERKQFAVHPATGALQVYTAEAVAAAIPVSTGGAAAAPAPGLFAAVKDKYLLRLGVPEDLLPVVRQIETDFDLEQAEKQLPAEAYEALYLLASGYSIEEVFREVEKPEEDETPVVDTTDFAAALQNEDSQRRFFTVAPDDKDLQQMLNAPLEQWRIFLHPKQKKLVRMLANGPVRVLGGAGTGKTVVAMHRARFLVEEAFPTDRILFTTFTKNLATDIQENLRKLCTVDGLSRIDVVNLDGWVSNFLNAQGYKPKVVFDEEGNEAWEYALAKAPLDLGLSPAFYRAEWEQVVQAQNVTDGEQYVHASRVGRGTKLSRDAKKRIWPVFQEYRAELNTSGRKEYVDLLRDARGLMESKKLQPPYRAVIVDEAQDMSAEALRLIRALVPEAGNDLFLVGDAHQRIYRNRASLGQCGINIKGRGKKLKVNYRTTDEIRRFAVALLEGRDVDDLDGGKDTQQGYMSLTHGEAPQVRRLGSLAEETACVVGRVRELIQQGTAAESICIVGRTKRIVESFAEDLREAGLAVYEIKRNAAEQRDKPGVRVATMHRVKGLEFEHLLVVSANDGVLPLKAAVADAEDEVGRKRSEMSERSLLYVALTRARRSATITCSGVASEFLR